VALTHTEALRQLIEKLEEISVKIGRSRTVSVGQRTVSLDITPMVDELKKILSELESQSTLLTSISAEDFSTETTLALLEAKDFATQATLSLLEGKDFATQVTLAAIASDIALLEAKDFFLSGDTTDGGDLLNELQSIDQNWNLLSVNNVALLALVDFQEDTRDNTQEIEDLLVGIDEDTNDTANRIALLLGRFEQQWSRTYTCTVAGSLILTFPVPASDTFRNTSFSFGAAFTSGRTITIVRTRSGASVVDIWEGGHVLPTLALKPIPNQGASSISKLPAQGSGFSANATENVVVSILGLTAVLPDVVTVRLIADKLNVTNMVTPVVSGSGTFTTGAEIRTVVTRF